MKNFNLDKKHMMIIIYILSSIIVLMGLVLGIKTFIDYRAEKKVEQINLVLDNATENRENCNVVLNFDKSLAKGNKYFSEAKFDGMKQRCDEKYNISHIETNEENCVNLIKETKKYFSKDYIILDDLENKREFCTAKYLKVKFSTGALFNVENDFKSEVKLDFSLDFFTDIGEENSDEYINNRIEAKTRLKNLIELNPNLDFSVEDIYLTPKKAILRLPLEPKTKYTISVKDFETKFGIKTQNQKFTITTPENKYFGLKILDKVTLFQNTNPPKFQIQEYNSDITKTKVKLCRIPNETYAKIEIYRKKSENQDVKNFFKNEIDKLKNFECSEKEITLKDNNTDQNVASSPMIRGELRGVNRIRMTKKEFGFNDIISGTNPKSGLYFIEFSDTKDREYFNKFNYPIFFGIVNSHITMKVSRNGEAFVFVNDFEGNPLENQSISLYLNNFKEKQKAWNDKKGDFDTNYLSVLDKNIYSEQVILGKTGKDGILKINLKEKFDDAFFRTFDQPWEYDWEGIYRTFFISSSSDNYLSYLNSTWNSGIAPWNFGYTVGNAYGYSPQENQDAINLDMYGMVEPEYYSHIYTDRLLYLPGETVNLKIVLRNSKDLSIPNDKTVVLKVSDSNGKEILSKESKINEYGSISENIKLAEASPLGNYNITILSGDNYIGWTNFSVEVFKNPKFKNEVTIETEGLNEGLVKIDKTDVKKHYYWDETTYSGKFKLKGKVFSSYYNGGKVKNADFTYKIYKQYYYENEYWNDCYYGCYWEPEKEFYSEGKGKLDGNGVGSFEANVDFSSSYSDYKYIVEVTVTDTVGDTISGTNSIIAKLPADYKTYNRELSLNFSSDNKFLKAGNKVEINGGLNAGKWSSDYNNKYLFIIKKKEYKTIEVDDVRGVKRPVTRAYDKLEKIMLVNDKNFSPTIDGRLRLNYKLDNVGEYVFEYGQIDSLLKIDLEKEIESFNEQKVLEKYVDVNNDIEICQRPVDYLGLKKVFNYTLSSECSIVTNTTRENLKINDLFTNKKYFSVLTYGEADGSNPVVDDNKIKVVPEKISYNLGEKARVLVRLPFSKGKILWTVEKQGVLKSEYINVNSNVFFKEIDVDDTFVPNAYIGVLAIEVDGNKVPEYKVGYTEIVVDKTDKKSFVNIKTDKKEYKPRDSVTLNLNVTDKNHKPNQSELTVMVVDDSLISLLGNVDLNTLEKFYKKLPFQIQTSITNVAMLGNYYFSRPGIVGGSGFGNFKGGDSAVSSRNIFKNTAYYNPSVITDKNGNAKVTFKLPDNLTNFRVMVVSNSKDNLFGYAESFIQVRKNVIIEDKTPQILRDGDISSIGANLFNNTDKEIGFKLELTANISVKDPVKNIIVPAGEGVNTIWEVQANGKEEEIKYTISALGDSLDNSDKIENTIKIKISPDLISHVIKTAIVEGTKKADFTIKIPENTDINKSKIIVSVSNNKLSGIEKIVSSLAQYPYGCIEQTTSSTLPNAILKKFDNLFSGIIEDNKKIDENIAYGIERIKSMQTSEGGFAYWEGSSESNLHITPYVVRSLVDMRDAGIKLPDGVLDKAVIYLENNLKNNQISDLEKAEIYWTLAKTGKNANLNMDTKNLDRHTLLAYTYGLVINNKAKPYKLIDQNIEKLKEQIKKTDEYNWYWDDLSDKAIFASMLMEYNYSRDYIDSIIGELYSYDWSSYYYSTQSKNNSFIAFAKYIEKYSKDSYSKFSFALGKYASKTDLEVGKTKINYFKQTLQLSDIKGENDEIGFNLTNIAGDRLYVDVTLESLPLDKTKIKTYSNGIAVKREFYEVTDENDLVEKCEWKENHKKREGGELVCIKPKGLKLIEGNDFKVGVLYKSKIIVDLKNASNKSNLVVEDYLVGSFRVINSKFNTEQISVRQNQNNWTWNHTEFNPDVVMANAQYIWDGTQSFEYYFRPEFGGKFTLPPAVAYIMYNPKIRANTEFRNISVK